MLPARQSRLGPTATGSARQVRARFGSTPATTALAVNSSPSARTTPVARPSRDVMCATSAPVRISTPAALAAAASASARTPGPPRTKTVWPAAPPSFPAASMSRTAVVPADHGPIAVYWTPRQAMAAWSASVSNDFGDEVGDRHRQDAGDGPAVVLAEATERSPEAEPGQRVTETRRFDVRWGLPGDVAEEARQRPDEPVEVRVAPGVGSGPGAQALGRPCRVAPQADRTAVGSRGEGPDVGADERQAVALEVEIADDRRAQPPDRVGERRHPRPGRELGRADGAADRLASLEHDGPQPGLAEIGRGDEPVVPAADDDRVVPVGRALVQRRHGQAAFRPRAFRTSSAAMRPFAPMIPPPGWVAEPHSHRSRTGVLNRA